MPLTFSVYISPNYLHTDISLQYQTQKKASFMDIHGYGYFQKKTLDSTRWAQNFKKPLISEQKKLHLYFLPPLPIY